MQIGGQGLPQSTNCFICAINRLFFEIYRGSAENEKEFYKVYESDIALDTIDPVYTPFKITGQQLCNSDKSLPLQIKFFNREGFENIY